MKIRIRSGNLMAYGTACDNARECDPSFAMLMLGCTCYEVLPDGSDGRSIDPTEVTAPDPWRLGKKVPARDAAWFRRAERYDRMGDTSCEALRARDPGAP